MIKGGDKAKKENLPLKRDKCNKIINHVNKYFGIECNTYFRGREVMIPRQIAIYLICKHILISTSNIGRLFVSKRNNYLDHSTVIHNRNTIIDLLSVKDKDITRYIDDLDEDCMLLSKMTEEELFKYNKIEEITTILHSFDIDKLIKIESKYKKLT